MAIPVITTVGRHSDKVACEGGQAVEYDIVASGTPTLYEVTALPAGMTLDGATGHITGTPTMSQKVVGQMTATNADGTSDPAQLVWYVSNPGTPVIDSDLFLDVTAGDPFDYTITATNTPTLFASNNLPSWATLDTVTGEITGTLPGGVGGTILISVQAQNATGLGRPADITIYVGPEGGGGGDKPVITSDLTLDLVVGDSMNYQIEATNSPTEYGILNQPVGVVCDTATGIITSDPITAPTSFTFSMRAINAAGFGSAMLTVTVGADTSGDGAPILPGISGVSAFGYLESNSFAESNCPPCPVSVSGQAPNPVQNLKVTPTGPTTAVATWDPPSNSSL